MQKIASLDEMFGRGWWDEVSNVGSAELNERTLYGSSNGVVVWCGWVVGEVVRKRTRRRRAVVMFWRGVRVWRNQIVIGQGGRNGRNEWMCGQRSVAPDRAVDRFGGRLELRLGELQRRRREDRRPHRAVEQKKKDFLEAAEAARGQKTGPAAGGRARWRRAI